MAEHKRDLHTVLHLQQCVPSQRMKLTVVSEQRLSKKAPDKNFGLFIYALQKCQ